LTDAPFLLIIAGPNGSGKSTLTKSLLAAGINFGIYINPDNRIDIWLEDDVPEWVFISLVAPIDELTRGSEGRVTLALHQSDGPLG
jgi:predicted ATP-binding protein involved in virulence